MRALIVFMVRISYTCVFILLLPENAYSRSEQDVKAAYLFNLIKFIDWPVSVQPSHYILCLVGQDNLHDKLSYLAQNETSVSEYKIQRFSNFDSNLLSDCHVVHIGGSERKFIKGIISEIGPRHIVTISSIEGFADLGGMIGFVKLGNVIRFQVNMGQTNRSKLSISSKILELAHKVVR